MFEIADIFRCYSEEYSINRKINLSQVQRRAFYAVTKCRTLALGGSVHRCESCEFEYYSYHSCKNRSCPKCHTKETEEWISIQKERLLPVKYFHLVFTIHPAARGIVLGNQKTAYKILMSSANKALAKLALDPRYIGGKIGSLSVLHTWNRTLGFHPHVHCLVPGGGLSPDGNWVKSNPNFIVPVQALSRIFRAIFIKQLRKEIPNIFIPPSLFKKDWNVYAKPTTQEAEKTLTYLGRYVHRAAITNRRIISVNDGLVVFKTKEEKTVTVSVVEFVRRFMLHVLPKGFHKIRYYGLLHPANKHLLNKLKNQFTVFKNKKEAIGKTKKQKTKLYCPLCNCQLISNVIPAMKHCINTLNARSP